MEEATIDNVNQQSLITMDDMFIQLGKLHMEKVNSDKIIEVLSKELNIYRKKGEQIETSTHERLNRLEESNKQYQKNNKELVEKIQELSAKLKEKEQEIQELKNKPARKKNGKQGSDKARS